MMRRISLIISPILVLLLCMLIPAGAMAKYPSKRIELVISFSPGGGTDRVGRTWAHFAEPYLGQTIFCTNQTGGSGAIGFSYGARAKPNGYTLTALATSLVIAPLSIKDYPVTYKDFTPLALYSVEPSCISVRSDSQFKTIQELVSYAKAHPGELKINNAGSGSQHHLGAIAFTNAAGIDLKVIPYSGVGPSLVAALGGHVDVCLTSTSELYQYVKAGKMRPLMVLGSARWNHAPDVPTAKEVGYDIMVESFRGIGAPKGLPKDVYDTLLDVCQKVADDPKFLKVMKDFGEEVHFLKGEAFEEWLKNASERYAKTAKEAGITPQ